MGGAAARHCRAATRQRRRIGEGSVMIPEEQTAWTEAAKAMFRDSDLGPLAKLIRGTSPIPPWMREYLGRMLDPSTNPNEADRLEFSRSEHLAREVKKNQD